jgi:aryl-alcohol dehydrogenase-like predicted oxidoreductase
MLTPERLSLGTAQIGLDYGLTNKNGQIRTSDAAELLQEACAIGIRHLDTAKSYGRAEEILGELGADRFRIVTKVPPLLGHSEPKAFIESCLLDSREKLKIERLYGVLFHDSADLAGEAGRANFRAAMAMKSEGVVEKIGVSIYDPSELEHIHDWSDLDVVQAPFNLFDQRLAASGWLDKLSSAGLEVQARSVFLQGALLATPQSLPRKLTRWASLFDELWNWQKLHGLTPLQSALSFVSSDERIGRLVIGVSGFGELAQISSTKFEPLLDFQQFASAELGLIDPRLW